MKCSTAFEALWSLGLIALIIGCTTLHGQKSAMQAEDVLITFIVAGDGAAGDTIEIPNADVYISWDDGPLEKVGVTDAIGRISIPRKVLARGAEVVIICQEWFFCGALLIRQDEFLQYQEHYIKLAPFAFL